MSKPNTPNRPASTDGGSEQPSETEAATDIPPDLQLNEREQLKRTLVQQTAKISWEELQRFYASGAVIGVAQGQDLIDIACEISLDNKAVVEQWLSEGQIFKVDDDTAKTWWKAKKQHWAVVIAPWVLVQEVNTD